MFVNNPEADRETALDEQQGYLGSFFVFGKVYCWGDDEEHCQPPPPRPFDDRRVPRRYTKVRVRTADGRLAELVPDDADTMTLTVVALRLRTGVPPRLQRSFCVSTG